MNYTQIPKEGIFAHFYCGDKHCRCDRIHAVKFSFYKYERVFFLRMCMSCHQRSEAVKPLVQEHQMIAVLDSMTVPKWNEFIKYSQDSFG